MLHYAISVIAAMLLTPCRLHYFRRHAALMLLPAADIAARLHYYAATLPRYAAMRCRRRCCYFAAADRETPHGHRATTLPYYSMLPLFATLSAMRCCHYVVIAAMLECHD